MAAPPRQSSHLLDRSGVSSASPETFDEILRTGAVYSVFQPIVELESGRVIGYEALARGPAGPFERPDVLFAAARMSGRLNDLDWACREARAPEQRSIVGLRGSLTLFLNVEPAAPATPAGEAAAAVWQRAAERLNVVVEITERELTARPAELLGSIRSMRERGFGIALDDVGADARSLALMPLLEPDVVKLDLRLVQARPTTEIAGIVSAVSAERERTGTIILAEGIEDEEHRRTALALGATYGQGWLFGRPVPLPTTLPPGDRELAVARQPPRPSGVTPFEVVRRLRAIRRGDKDLLLAITRHLEDQALTIAEGAVVVSAFQDASRFTPATHRRYSALAERAAFVAALGVGMDPRPAPGVRGAALASDDALRDEWSIVVVGPHFAGALVAADLGDRGPDMARRFDFAVTYDRPLVVEAARSLMARVVLSP